MFLFEGGEKDLALAETRLDSGEGSERRKSGLEGREFEKSRMEEGARGEGGRGGEEIYTARPTRQSR